MWTSDSFGLVGSIRSIKPVYSFSFSITPGSYGVISSHHSIAGLLSIATTLWHIQTRPVPTFLSAPSFNSLEQVLASNIPSVFFAAFITTTTMWYGSVSTPVELFGPSRYQWDNNYFSATLESRVKDTSKAWATVPDKLLLYDYIGCNPSKGGLFRSGPQAKGDGIVQSWIGHASLRLWVYIFICPKDAIIL